MEEAESLLTEPFVISGTPTAIAQPTVSRSVEGQRQSLAPCVRFGSTG